MHPLIAEVQKGRLKNIPELASGYTVRIHQKIKEGEKERIQIFEGLIIKVNSGHGVHRSITVRKIVEGIGVEKIFPIHSSNIAKIEVRKKASVRRAKLYFMRNRSGKAARLLEEHVTDEERKNEATKRESLIEEAIKAEAKRKAEAEKTQESAVVE